MKIIAATKSTPERMSDLYAWPKEKVEEFVRSLLATADTAGVSRALFATTNSPSLLSAAEKLRISSEDYYTSRQTFLRSYRLTREQSAASKLNKWLKNKARALVH